MEIFLKDVIALRDQLESKISVTGSNFYISKRYFTKNQKKNKKRINKHLLYLKLINQIINYSMISVPKCYETVTTTDAGTITQTLLKKVNDKYLFRITTYTTETDSTEYTYVYKDILVNCRSGCNYDKIIEEIRNLVNCSNC